MVLSMHPGRATCQEEPRHFRVRSRWSSAWCSRPGCTRLARSSRYGTSTPLPARSSSSPPGRDGLYVGEDLWTFLNTYKDHPSILDISCGSTTLSRSVADQNAGIPAMKFARELATWRPGSPPRSSGCTSGITTTARPAPPARAAVPWRVRRPDGTDEWGGTNGNSCRPRCLSPLAHGERRRV
jgi:hypothetical protein